MVFFCISQIISPNNVAIYGGLCALATFERQELQKKVLSSRYIVSLMFHDDVVWELCLSVVVLCNKLYHLVSCICSSFKLFLELEPQLRDVLYKFHESQYAACLKLLDEMKVQYIGDTSITLVKPGVVTEKTTGRPWLAYLDKFWPRTNWTKGPKEIDSLKITPFAP